MLSPEEVELIPDPREDFKVKVLFNIEICSFINK